MNDRVRACAARYFVTAVYRSQPRTVAVSESRSRAILLAAIPSRVELSRSMSAIPVRFVSAAIGAVGAVGSGDLRREHKPAPALFAAFIHARSDLEETQNLILRMAPENLWRALPRRSINIQA